ncbi:class I SAM-dependent methyltransferase [Jidongwangia harbinensis]|uniref:class I SAM-dependent methyltransferase n=1 Tax=Jidongwangia harbinensis TaxID=2878561 RepID=UPI001CDA2C1B|nr:class I SAM-dependent methyltransferase [Jidongwangia harbinensis]MCA2218911.1 methyltransferase domain-containing protein [Jidongwangia harbinensis]
MLLTVRMAFDFAAAYDELNPDDRDHLCYAALADERGATRVLDLGCGTGRLTRALAARGRTAVGIDPDPAMLRVARSGPGGEHVDWRRGFSDRADTCSADFAVMSGHVAQVFTDDAAWLRALRDLHRALVADGVLAFESRHPAARAWERWTRAATLRTVDTPDGPVEFWHETAWVSLPLVAYDTVTRDPRTGEDDVHRAVLAFRDAAALELSLGTAGFTVSHRYGDWTRAPLTDDSPEIILVARRGAGPEVGDGADLGSA